VPGVSSSFGAPCDFFTLPERGTPPLDTLTGAKPPLLRTTAARNADTVLRRQPDGLVVCASLAVADRFWPRARGLLGRRGLEPDQGLLIRPARSVHMFWMRFAIDAVFLDEHGVIVRIAGDLAPWRVASCRGAREVVELRAGRAAQLGLGVGQKLVVGSR